MTADIIRPILEDFIDDLYSRMDSHRLQEVLDAPIRRTLTKDDLGLDDPEFTGYPPERWLENHLIEDVLDALELDWEPQLYGRDVDRPDFEVRGVDVPLMGSMTRKSSTCRTTTQSPDEG